MNLINSYARLPEHFYAHTQTASVPKPALIAWNEDLAAHLGLNDLGADKESLARIFSGSEPLPGGKTIAMAYAGHQFGHFVPQLGDGRAALLGEVVSPVDGGRYDIQLKGSGQTPFSRRGDGKSSLGPVIREYLLSEAMHRLGVPTTRALAAVSTGEMVIRESDEPGGVLTRVAASHIRVGTFQFFAARNDQDALAELTHYATARHYPDATTKERPVLAFFSEVVEAQAKLIAHWMALGFIHGVMNTDNTAISGETLDYGPCAFMDEFHIDKVFSSIDQHGRYAYGQQANMAQWNLARLAECLMMLEGEQEDYELALERFQPHFEAHYFALMREKLGLASHNKSHAELVTGWLQHLQDHQLDYSLSFRQLAARMNKKDSPVFGQFEIRWLQCIDEQPGGRQSAGQLMASTNPVVIPRNHQVERAIQAAFQGDFSVFNELRQVLAEPFTEQPGLACYSEPPLAHERVAMTFCGT
ncbi:MAG: YdiU family protein [Candidatus Thiodiazotropha sp. (ex Lucinoma borealis)]|nr:YdiU family protein [Candidatus Thiodiazotropha sp. (ex Lucinoma borealis)]